MKVKNPLKLGRKMKPTQKHRMAIWENMLGTVYARNDAGETRYFDYDWAGAIAFAGADDTSRDLRTWKLDRSYQGMRKGQTVLYIKEAAK